MGYEGTTREGRAAMEDCGFDPVPLEDPGAPTPGRIADRLCDLAGDLEDAVEAGDLGAIANGVAAVRRLVLALDAWDACLLHRLDCHASRATLRPHGAGGFCESEPLREGRVE